MIVDRYLLVRAASLYVAVMLTAASGLEAIARALEHVHLGWAMIAFVIRLPGIGAVLQLLADASGAEPRAIRNAVPGES
jgi:hypothetical protein